MIKIRPYEHTDRYHLEKMIITSFQEQKIIPPDADKILQTIGFYYSFPQHGKIYIILFNENPVGYSIVDNKWSLLYGQISYSIEELFISKSYRKYKLETNLIEYLIKHDRILRIEINIEKIKPSSRKIFKFFKFERSINISLSKKIEV